MIKKRAIVFLVLFVSCNFEEPKSFSKFALSDTVSDLRNQDSSIKERLEAYRGKKVFIDIWASWCGDCIKGLPIVRELQKEFPNVIFLFLSVDKSEKAWKNGIERFQIEGEHFRLPKGMQSGAFVDFLDVSWIPRYMLINENGGIEVFNVTDATDATLQTALKKSI
jgi:thiol-disulfide isomerase/thioredoxin